MPLLNLDFENTIGNVIRDFKSETGLRLVIYDGRKPADKSMTIYQLWRKKSELDFRLLLERKSRLVRVSPESFVRFDYNDRIGDIEQLIEGQSGLKVKICRPNGRRVPWFTMLYKSLPGFKRPEIDCRKISRLSRKITAITEDIISQCGMIMPGLNKRMRSRSDWLDDYEIEVVIDYCLSEDDPLYNEDFDNIVLHEKKYISKESKRDYYYDIRGIKGMDYNDMEPEDKKNRQKHPYLFHEIYKHTGLAKEDVQRIGNIYVDIKVWHQHFYREPVRRRKIKTGK